VAFTAASLRHPQAFLAPKSLNLLVIDGPALTTDIVVGGPEPTARMILGVLTQPGSQRGIGILGCRRAGLVALSSAVLPGYPAGEPFADPQHPLQVTNGRPPVFRA
jgi:hypothetical protein